MSAEIDRHARAVAKRNEAARRTKARAKAGGGPAPLFFTAAAVQRLAELNADTPAGPRTYTIEGIAAALRCSTSKVMGLVRVGKLPAPHLIVDGNPRWQSAAIEPLLQRRGYALAATVRDRELAKLTAARKPAAAQEWTTE